MPLSKRLLSLGIRRGVLGGSSPFIVLAGLAGAWRLIKILSGSVKETVYLEPLEPGQELVISHRRETYRDEERRKDRSHPR